MPVTAAAAASAEEHVTVTCCAGNTKDSKAAQPSSQFSFFFSKPAKQPLAKRTGRQAAGGLVTRLNTSVVQNIYIQSLSVQTHFLDVVNGGTRHLQPSHNRHFLELFPEVYSCKASIQNKLLSATGEDSISGDCCCSLMMRLHFDVGYKVALRYVNRIHKGIVSKQVRIILTCGQRIWKGTL